MDNSNLNINDTSDIKVEKWVEFISYYRYYIDEFAVDVLGITLSPFQRLTLRAMGRHTEIMIVACRGLTKSFISAVFFICVGILYSNIKLGIASGKGQQARNVIIQKIKGELMNNPNVAREIKDIRTGKDDCVVIFHNNSEIRAIVLGHDGESARSWRFNMILVDEARIVTDRVISEILSPMTQTKRSTLLTLQGKLKRLLPIESGKMIYISSAYLKTSSFYQRFMKHYTEMKNGSKDYFVAAFPYQIGIDEGILSEEGIEKERNKISMTEEMFEYEYGAIFVGSSGDSYYPYELTEQSRIVNKGELGQPHKSTVSYVISHDVAISGNKQNDNAATTVIKLKEKSNGTYIKEVVYIKAHKGMDLPEQHDFLRNLLLKFPNTIKLIIDVRGNGQSLPRFFAEPWEYKDDSGKIIECPPLVPDDDEKAMKIKGAIPLIRRVNATQASNNLMYTYMKACFEDKSLRLLRRAIADEFEEEDEKMTLEEFSLILNTDALVSELSNIKQETTENNNIQYIRITKQTKRDRVTSLGYGLQYIYELEDENLKSNKEDQYDFGFFFN
ncbi:hypothetical protein G7L40_00540 [Paenibacillus polymyxa]|uniref:Mu-like prophage FluMu protein gp28 n=1 Tax=Paenibacillus polymyxa TaxID=1406 RepID=A0A378XVE0_PAEPO|nr:hypothetical protein [Paenibacillus polymyxa]MBE7897198.1 hypothetical protein [Paenibacillus polymyxa]MBG9763052.1 hypothetical protein [Paenibacillus polymyxa]MCC3257552.1 hypothetical protein [Paenibacillus polymyxa]QPK51361.1 hypothetical protein G7035_00540 [Paenibacillus polymyxa]QPK56451.1 hypothetical protein G7L40_00540 [Paenibacillus polymyxa]